MRRTGSDRRGEGGTNDHAPFDHHFTHVSRDTRELVELIGGPHDGARLKILLNATVLNIPSPTVIRLSGPPVDSAQWDTEPSMMVDRYQRDTTDVARLVYAGQVTL